MRSFEVSYKEAGQADWKKLSKAFKLYYGAEHYVRCYQGDKEIVD